ncbi:MAG: DUF1641 domain-containing protein [Chloroflexota bacterium]|nr:DUF1641 domain-containing protein [Chloroflexota bacterium]
MEADLVILNKKIDYLTEIMETQRRRQLELEELQRDMIPIANHMIKLSIEELAEIGTEFQLEDLLFLLKRMLRNTELVLSLMDRIESLYGLSEELNLLGKPMFNQMVERLDQMERDGYFDFARAGWDVTQRIVDEFSEEDVHALGDNIVTIMHTIRKMTQPEIMAIADNAIDAISGESQDVPDSVSTWALLRELSDPQVRRGLMRMLGMVKVLADQPHTDRDDTGQIN